MEKSNFFYFAFFQEDAERVTVMGSGAARPQHRGSGGTAYCLMQGI